jgi:hypothetical protein
LDVSRKGSVLSQITLVGVVERDSKTQIPELIWAFVFGFAAGES